MRDSPPPPNLRAVRAEGLRLGFALFLFPVCFGFPGRREEGKASRDFCGFLATVKSREKRWIIFAAVD